MKKLLWLLLTAAVCLWLAPVAAGRRSSGGNVRGWYLSPASVGQRATAVVRVEVDSLSTLWQQDVVWSEAQCRVLEVCKGRAPETIRLRQLGGQFDQYTTVAGPMASLQVGDQWLLAVDPMPDTGAWTVVAMIQGAFLIEGSNAVRDYRGFVFVEPPPSDAALVAGREIFDLEQLRQLLSQSASAVPSSAPEPDALPGVDERQMLARAVETVAQPDAANAPGTSAQVPGPLTEQAPASALAHRLWRNRTYRNVAILILLVIAAVGFAVLYANRKRRRK